MVVGRGTGTTPAIWDARAGISNYALANRLIVGSNSSFNQVFITNGAVLNGSDYTFLAFNSGSNNALTISGPGSTFNSPFGFFIGADGNANRMLISKDDFLFHQVSTRYPKARNAAERVRSHIVSEYDTQLPNEEVAYLTLHIERLTTG